MKKLNLTLYLIVFVSLNGYSQTWESTSLDSVTVHSIAIKSNGYIFVGTENDGVYRSTDGGVNWTQNGGSLFVGPIGSENQKIFSIGINSVGDIFVPLNYPQPGRTKNIFSSTDNGDTWDSLGQSHFYRCIAFSNSYPYIYCGNHAVGVVRSTDNGATWSEPESDTGMTATKINVLIVDSNDIIYAATSYNESTGGGGVYRSSDYGVHWVSISAGLNGQSLTVLSLLKKPNGYLFAGTDGTGIYLSTNDGLNWEAVNTGISGQALYVYSLAVNPQGDIFAGTADGIFRSTDDGDNWEDISSGLSNSTIISIAIAPDGFGYAGTDGAGIFRTTTALPVEINSFSANFKDSKVILNWETATEVNNFGFEIQRAATIEVVKSWEKVGFVQGNGNSNSPKEYSFIDDKLYGGSKFEYRLKQIDNDGKFEYSKVVEVVISSDKFALYQNYPNPFNPTTKIRYILNEKTQLVSLKIYDILGNEIQTLVNSEQPAGIYEITWTADKFPSGIYFYKLQAGSFVEIRNMILLK
jgi:hypothetical protein